MTLHSTSKGEGPAVVLVHGLGSSLHEWDSVVPALAEAEFQALACDLLGHGESPKPERSGEYHFEAVYEAMVGWIDAMKLVEPFHLVGHSLGGYLSLKFALKYPARLRGLVLIDPLYSLEQIPLLLGRFPSPLLAGQKILHAAPEEWLNKMMKLRFIPSARLPTVTRRQQARDTKQANPNITRFIRTIPTLLPEMANLQIPVLVVWGGQDRSCKPQSFQRLVNSLPQARAFCLQGCGHHPHSEKATEVNREMISFLSEHLKSTRAKGQLRRSK